MANEEIFIISLTGENSHTLKLPAGQGSLSIGTKGISKGKYDIWVEKDKPINWDAFNELYTPYGRQNAEKYPYGDLPRWFYYFGNDTGFVEWSAKRRIEEFFWKPNEDTSIDLTQANIYMLTIQADEGKVKVSVGSETKKLTLSGRLENIEIEKYDTLPFIDFVPLLSQTETSPYKLPVYKAIEDAKWIGIKGEPLGQPFDCTSLLQFPNLLSISLSGSLANLEALTELKNLQSIALRYVPDLTGMPKLAACESLNHFIGWNIEETAGKALRAEGRELSKVKEFEYFSVSSLKKKIWFATEYGIPFSGWEDKNAKLATRAYKACLKEIKKSKTEDEAHEAIAKFIEAINKLPDIETTEREDTGTAVSQLVEASGLEISQETWERWFDELRDF